MTAPGALPTESFPSPISPVPIPTRPALAAVPPLVPGADQSSSHTNCDQGYQLNNATGFGTRGGRGTQETSCYFANTVLVSYWNAYRSADAATRIVSAPGAVGLRLLRPVRVLIRGTWRSFLMRCSGDGSSPWIKCTGGQDAVVYLW